MLSDFRKKKLLHVFHTLFDLDKSGSVTKEDFEQGAQKVAKVRGWTLEDAQYKKILEANLKIWELLKQHADNDDDGQVTQDEWITMWDNFITNQYSIPEWQSQNCKYMFGFLDSGNDGVLDEAEYAAAYAIYGLDKELAGEAFKKASGGKDSVSFEQFQELWKQFFLSEDPDVPGNYIFGYF